ncbi:hypothetical protein [Stomatohabitans albus]|uniref:hypothetical protein n=1 Tax=Stomatohabitans albus TaxID=3110766 RepID=UPI00300CECB8
MNPPTTLEQSAIRAEALLVWIEAALDTLADFADDEGNVRITVAGTLARRHVQDALSRMRKLNLPAAEIEAAHTAIERALS